MVKGSWAATAADSEIVAANKYRGTLIIQIRSGSPTSFAFGEAAIFAHGLQLVTAGDFIEITGFQATLAVHAICDTGLSSAGGYQES